MRSLMWFRQDLRLADNPAWLAASQAEDCLAIYIDDTSVQGSEFALGAASRLWLDQSLRALSRSLNHRLMCYQGNPAGIISALIERFQITDVYWNRCYEPWQIQRDTAIKSQCQAIAACQTFNASLLWEPWQVVKADGTPYKVFTPYYKNGCLNAVAPRSLLDAPTLPTLLHDQQAQAIDQLALVDTHPYAQGLQNAIDAGEVMALQKLEQFIDESLAGYKMARDMPSQQATSRLSAHLHFGEISPNQVWHYVQSQVAPSDDRDHFLSELAWREFSYYLLYHFPQLPQQNWQAKFDHFDWRDDVDSRQAWQRGLTGYPIVDAGMRELWQTGWMHNRVRMIVGSFLVKNLRQHWCHGARWFWDCLFDADLASNSASWQWVAGSGADAAPYFRIFNPTTQAKKFDPDGLYIKRFVPELSDLPLKYLFEPWLAPASVLRDAGVDLGCDYPQPIVDLKQSREAALAAFSKLKDAMR